MTELHPEAVARLAVLLRRVEAVRRAVEVEGRDRHWHRHVMRRHRAEWPTLWRALDDLLETGQIPELGPKGR